jgi:hypothetical protein
MWHVEADQSRYADAQQHYTGLERRMDSRIETPFPAIVRGADLGARRFEEHRVLDNLSSRGLHLRLARPVRQGSRLFVLIVLSGAGNADGPAGCIALHGVVLRVEARPGSVFGTAVRITRHRFIYLVLLNRASPERR